MGAPVAIDLHAKEQKEYERLCRSGKTPIRLRERLTIVPLAPVAMPASVVPSKVSLLFSNCLDKAIACMRLMLFNASRSSSLSTRNVAFNWLRTNSVRETNFIRLDAY